MTAYIVTVAFVIGLVAAAYGVWLAALVISDLAHRLRGDVRCSAGCPCRGSALTR